MQPAHQGGKHTPALGSGIQPGRRHEAAQTPRNDKVMTTLRRRAREGRQQRQPEERQKSAANEPVFIGRTPQYSSRRSLTPSTGWPP
jgi:hypothetical protein